MSLSLKERFNYNFYLWLFGLTKVRMINFVSPRIVDIDDTNNDDDNEANCPYETEEQNLTLETEIGPARGISSRKSDFSSGQCGRCGRKCRDL